MNYIAELNAFDDYLDRNPDLSANARLLWTRLIQAANRAMWKQPFTIALTYLAHKCHLTTRAVQNARLELERYGLIKWESRGGKLSAQYTLISVVGILFSQDDSQSISQDDSQSDARTATYININKNNKPKTMQEPPPNLGNNGQTQGERKEWIAIYENRIGPLTPVDGARLIDLEQEYGTDALVAAIKEGADRGARSVNYIVKVITGGSWQRKNETRKKKRVLTPEEDRAIWDAETGTL